MSSTGDRPAAVAAWAICSPSNSASRPVVDTRDEKGHGMHDPGQKVDQNSNVTRSPLRTSGSWSFSYDKQFRSPTDQDANNRVELWRRSLLQNINKEELNEIKVILGAARDYRKQDQLCLRREAPLSQTTPNRSSSGTPPPYVKAGVMPTTTTIPIVRVIRRNQDEIFYLMLDYGVSIDEIIEDTNGGTLAHEVALYGTVGMMKSLILRQANIEAVDQYGDTPLAKALKTDNMDVASVLLENGCSISGLNTKGKAHIECLLNGKVKLTDRHLKILEQVLERVSSAEDTKLEDLIPHPLQLAFSKIPDDLMLRVFTLFLHNDCDPDVTDPFGATILHYVCGYNSRIYGNPQLPDHLKIKLARLLLEHGADPNKATENEMDTPLHTAAMKGGVKLQEVLLEFGANKDITNVNGLEPIALSPKNVHNLVLPVYERSEQVKKKLEFQEADEELSPEKERELNQACRKVYKVLGSSWKNLYRVLMVKYDQDRVETDIDEIEYGNKNQLKEQGFQALNIWKKKAGSAATIEALCQALKECELNNIAESIENEENRFA